jgi:mono/diheme cytochrome c family protein
MIPSTAAGGKAVAQRYLRAVAVAAALGAASAAFAQATDGPSAMESLTVGEAVVQRNCAMCHAVGATGASPKPEAPPFRELFRRFDVDEMGEGQAQGILTRHPAMPEFRLTPQELIGVIRYLRSIQEKQSASLAAPVAPTERPSRLR